MNQLCHKKERRDDSAKGPACMSVACSPFWRSQRAVERFNKRREIRSSVTIYDRGSIAFWSALDRFSGLRLYDATKRNRNQLLLGVFIADKSQRDHNYAFESRTREPISVVDERQAKNNADKRV